MKYSKIGLQQLTEAFEGCRLVAYQDSVGRWTIGYGHTAGVKEGDICSQMEAEAWLMNDTQWAEDAVNRLVTVELTQGEFDAMVDFTFNLGSGSLQHSTLLELVNKHDFVNGVKEFVKWDKAGGVVVIGLLRRRIAEQQRFQQ